jgi:hypothetical protein
MGGFLGISLPNLKELSLMSWMEGTCGSFPGWKGLSIRFKFSSYVPFTNPTL